MLYTKTPVGHNTLGRTVSHLCKTSGITGFKTNHSLRVTRLFHSGVDELLIMSITGVRAYKRVSGDQKEQVSTVLNNTTNGTNPEKKPKLSTHTEEKQQSKSPMPLAIYLSNSSNITINYNCNH